MIRQRYRGNFATAIGESVQTVWSGCASIPADAVSRGYSMQMGRKPKFPATEHAVSPPGQWKPGEVPKSRSLPEPAKRNACFFDVRDRNLSLQSKWAVPKFSARRRSGRRTETRLA